MNIGNTLSSVDSRRQLGEQECIPAGVAATRCQYQRVRVWCHFLPVTMLLPGEGGYDVTFCLVPCSSKEGSLEGGCPGQNDRRFWKHYLSLRSVTISNFVVALRCWNWKGWWLDPDLAEHGWNDGGVQDSKGNTLSSVTCACSLESLNEFKGSSNEKLEPA